MGKVIGAGVVDEAIRMLRAGKKLPGITLELGVPYEPLRKAVYRRLGSLQLQAKEVNTMRSYGTRGNWWASPYKTVTKAIEKEMRRTTDAYVGVSYVIGLPPDMSFLYINKTGAAMYRTAQDAPIGMSVWQVMAQPSVYERIVNLDEYHRKGIKAVKALLEEGEARGSGELARVRANTNLYVEFVSTHPKLQYLWNTLDSDLLALISRYPKTLTHWDPKITRELPFDVMWTYRHDWRAFQVLYTPIGDETEELIWDLDYTVRSVRS